MDEQTENTSQKSEVRWFEAATIFLESEYPALWEEETSLFGAGTFDGARLQLITSAARIESADQSPDSRLYLHLEQLLPLFHLESAGDLPVALYRSHQPSAPLTQLIYLPGELHIVINTQNSHSRNLLENHARQILAVELARFSRLSADTGRSVVAQQVLNRLLVLSHDAPVVMRSIQNFERSLALWCDAHVMQRLTAPEQHHAFLTDMCRADEDHQSAIDKEITATATDVLTAADDPGTVADHFVRLYVATTQASPDQSGPQSLIIDTAAVQPPLQLEGIDLLQRRELQELTREFLNDFLVHDWLQTPLIQSWQDEFKVAATTSMDQVLWPKQLSDQLQTYFCSLLLDAATCDPEIADAALAAGFLFADKRGLTEKLREMARHQLKLGKRAREKIEKNAAELVATAGVLS